VFIFNEVPFFFSIGSEQGLDELDEKQGVILD
jgi:hypothetical protein